MRGNIIRHRTSFRYNAVIFEIFVFLLETLADWTDNIREAPTASTCELMHTNKSHDMYMSVLVQLIFFIPLIHLPNKAYASQQTIKTNF